MWSALRRNFHWKCLVLSGMIEACLAVVAWCQIAHSAYSTFSVAVPLAQDIATGGSGGGHSPGAIARDSR